VARGRDEIICLKLVIVIRSQMILNYQRMLWFNCKLESTRESQVHSMTLTSFTFLVLLLLLCYFNLKLIVALGSKRLDGYLTFKFLKDAPEWDDSRYQRLVSLLRKTVPGEYSSVKCVFDFPYCEFFS
jgi:hypothetical protein